jgi:hypothetical protein
MSWLGLVVASRASLEQLPSIKRKLCHVHGGKNINENIYCNAV